MMPLTGFLNGGAHRHGSSVANRRGGPWSWPGNGEVPTAVLRDVARQTPAELTSLRLTRSFSRGLETARSPLRRRRIEMPGNR